MRTRAEGQHYGIRFAAMGQIAAFIGVVAVLTGAGFSTAAAHEWKDRSGKFKLKAEIVQLKDGKIYLERADGGGVLTVPLDKLSFDDCDYLRTVSNSHAQNYLRNNDLPTRATEHILQFDFRIDGFSFSPQKDLLAVFNRENLQVFNTTTWKLIAKYKSPQGAFSDCRFVPSGEKLLSLGTNYKFAYWTIKPGKLTRSDEFGRLIMALQQQCFSPDGEYALSADYSKFVYWNCKTGKVIHTLKGPSTKKAEGCFINAKGTQAVALYAEYMLLFDLKTGETIQQYDYAPSSEHDSAVLSESGRIFAYVHYHHGLKVKRTTDGTTLGSAKTGSHSSIGLSPDDTKLVKVDSKLLEIYSVPGLKSLRKFSIAQGSHNRMMRFSHDSKLVGVRTRNQTLHVFKLTEF